MIKLFFKNNHEPCLPTFLAIYVKILGIKLVLTDVIRILNLKCSRRQPEITLYFTYTIT